MKKQILLKNAAATEAFGKVLASSLKPPLVVFLKGELGAGKTTLVRGFLRGLGVTEAVKSPTYTLVEAYPLSLGTVYHFDLYRILEPKELEIIGIQEYFEESAIVFVEWPDNGVGFIPAADLQIELSVVTEGRKLQIEFLSETSFEVATKLLNNPEFKLTDSQA